MATKKRFDGSMFRDTEHTTAASQASFANDLVEFIAADFPRGKFTTKLYNVLCQRFGHIAHFDRDGFFAEFFTSTEDKVKFLKHTIDWPAPFAELEWEIQEALQREGVLERYGAQLREERERSEREQLSQLKAKYEVAVTPSLSVLVEPQPPIMLNLVPLSPYNSGDKIPPLSDFQSLAFAVAQETDEGAQLLLF